MEIQQVYYFIGAKWHPQVFKVYVCKGFFLYKLDSYISDYSDFCHVYILTYKLCKELVF